MLLTISYEKPSPLTELKIMTLTAVAVTLLGWAVVGVVAVVMAMPANVWIGLAVTLAYAVATYPRSKAVRR